MLSINKSKAILNANRKKKLSNEEVKNVLELLEVFARLSVEQFNNQIK
jgi:hypothetical protein